MDKTFVQELQEITAGQKKKLAEQKIKDEAEEKVKLFEKTKQKLRDAASYSLDHCIVLSHFGPKNKHNIPTNLNEFHAWRDLDNVKGILDLLNVKYKVKIEKCEGKENKNYIFTLKAYW